MSTHDAGFGSHASTPRSNRSTEVLTPSRRVKALLAQFDSDSDDDLQPSRNLKLAARAKTAPPNDKVENESGESSGDEDELPVAPRGRLAARMQATKRTINGPTTSPGDQEKQDEVSSSPITETSEQPIEGTPADNEDELLQTPPRRHLLKRKISPVVSNGLNDEEPASPMFFPSPSEARQTSPADQSPARPATSYSPAGASMAKSKFLALVAKHREERLAKEALEEKKREERLKQLREVEKSVKASKRNAIDPVMSSDDDLTDDEAGAKLTQNSRPARKAGKKAIEEMNRETQRMSRNMQLAHRARTKRKITKESLLARFNFPVSGVTKQKAVSSSNANSAAGSDGESAKGTETAAPMTSPIISEATEKDSTTVTSNLSSNVVMAANTDVEELPSLEQMKSDSAEMSAREKGKGRADVPIIERDNAIEPTKKPAKPFRVKWSKKDAVIARAADSDDDLDIVTSQTKTKQVGIFESLPARKATEAPSHLALRSLANLLVTSDKGRSSTNSAQMEADLRSRARLQARKEREEKLEELRARGVVFQTGEEREKQQQEVEDLVERAREEAAEIQRREKETAKKDGTYVKDLDDDSDDEGDGDFQDDGDEQFRDGEDEDDASGSEEEDSDEGDADDEDAGAQLDVEEEEEEERSDTDANVLIDDIAGEEDDGEQTAEEETAEVVSAGEDVQATPQVSRRSRKSRVVEDDDEEEDDDRVDLHKSPILPRAAKTPISLPKSARKEIPGLDMSDELPMDLSEAFAATMAESQTQAQSQDEDSIQVARELPSPGLSLQPQLHRMDSLDMIANSQPNMIDTPTLNFRFSLPRAQDGPAPQSPIGLGLTQPSQVGFEPTQDAGYMMSPLLERRLTTPGTVPPQSTVDTVILPEAGEESPLVQRRGRLRRGRITAEVAEEVEDAPETAFTYLQRAQARKAKAEAAAAFNKAKSAAKEIADEDAEESEDEYAGLGGASDDEAGEENEEDRRMIHDDAGVGEGDEAMLAGLHADKERKQDEAAVSKLLKDITTGALRRKRGAADDLDLSDEEDAVARRREAKRREFARMRRELLKDEAIGKIADDKKKLAFLKSIEDRDDADDEDEDDGLGLDWAETQEDESQSQSQKPPPELSVVPESSMSERQDSTSAQRPLAPIHTTTSRLNSRPAPLFPERSSFKIKPKDHAELQRNVSFLIEEPDSQHGVPEQYSSDSEDDEPAKYVDLARHLEDQENEEDYDAEDLGDFIVDDSQYPGDLYTEPDDSQFKKPHLPSSRRPYAERRTPAKPQFKPRSNVVDRLALLRQASSFASASTSSNGNNTGEKMAFFTASSGPLSLLRSNSLTGAGPSALLRRATTNSSLNGSETSATGVTTGNGVERGAAGGSGDREMVRKASSGRRMAVNYVVEKVREGRVEKKAGRKGENGKKGGKGFLSGLFGGVSAGAGGGGGGSWS